MNKIVKLFSGGSHDPEIETIREEAETWVVQLDGKSLTKTDLVEFRKWLDKSPDHVKEFQAIARLWDKLDQVVFEMVFSDEAQNSNQPNKVSGARKRAFGLPGIGYAALAVLALVAGLAVYDLAPEKPSFVQYRADYATAIGEVKGVELPDGSELQLNTNTTASVIYRENARFVRLIDGEAFFDVARDPDRPFIVYAGDVAVEAVGTAFTVYVKDDLEVEVTVTAGKVRLASLPQDVARSEQPDLQQLEAAEALGFFVKGQQALLKNRIEVVEKLDFPQLEKELSWRNGMLIFDDDPLEDVVREISRYTQTRFIFAEQALREIKVGGYFPAGQTSIMLQMLERSFDIQAEEIGEGMIYLSSKEWINGRTPAGVSNAD